MPYLRGSTYHVKRKLPGIGRTRKTLDTESKRRAETLERMLIRLCERGNLGPVRAWLDDEVSIHELADAFDGGSIPELMQRIRSRTVPLSDGFAAALASKEPDVKASTFQRYSESAAIVERVAAEHGVETVAEACTPDFIQTFKRARLAEDVARQTVNRGLQAISLLATYAVRKGWIDERPTIKRYASPERVRYLEPDHLAAYMAALRRPFRPQFELLVATGMRLGETESLRPCDMKFGGGECRALLRDAKTPAGVRAVYVPRWAAESLRQHMEGRGESEPIFQIPRRTVQAEHNRACEIVGITGYRLHDHRHTAAVALARAGMPIPTLQKQLGHKTIQQTMKYAAFHPDYHDVGRFFDAVEARFGLSEGTDQGTTADEPESEHAP